MDRNSWKGALRRIKRAFRTDSSGNNPNKQDRMKRGIGWTLAIVAALIIAGIGLSTRRANLAPSTAQQNGTVSNLLGAQVGGGETESQFMALQAAKEFDADGSVKQPPQGGVSPVQQTQPWDRMVVRTANLQIKVKDVAVSLDEVRGLAGAHGGYVTQTDSHQDGEYTIATITIQVPSEEFDGVVSLLRKIGVKPIQETVTSADVTEEYTDLQSQSRNLAATEQRILSLMEKAVQIDDVLTLDRELRTIRSEIERVQGRLNYLGKRAEMSTVTVSLYPDALPVVATVKSPDAWDPAQITLNAWNASLDVLAGIGRVVISAVVFLWWAVPVLLAIWVVMRPRRRTAIPATPAGEPS